MSICEDAEKKPDRADAEKQSDLLLEQSRKIYGSLVNFALANGTVLIAIHGWFISSEAAQDLLKDSGWISSLVCVSLFFYSAFHAACLYLFRRRTETICDCLTELAYLPKNITDLQRIGPFTIILVSVYHLGSVVVVMLYILGFRLSD